MKVNKFFLQFLVDILQLGSGSMDPRSQTLADPTDPDPKHWVPYGVHALIKGLSIFIKLKKLLILDIENKINNTLK